MISTLIHVRRAATLFCPRAILEPPPQARGGIMPEEGLPQCPGREIVGLVSARRHYTFTVSDPHVRVLQ